MRTTVDLPDDLLAEAKQRAVREGRSLSAVVSDALRSSFARPRFGGAGAVQVPDLRAWGTPARRRPRRRRGLARRDGGPRLIVPYVNVLVYAHRSDAHRHDEYRQWAEEAFGGDEPFGIADLVLTGFVRIVTHPRIYADPTPLPEALAACRSIRSRPNGALLAPGPRHWAIFVRLCTEAGARGNLVADAYLAALAIETGSDWITTDGDYRRFPGLRVRHPLDG